MASTPRRKGAARRKPRPTAKPRGRGRPTDYRPEFAAQAQKLCMLGYTDRELGEFFGCGEKTINNWKKRHKDFLQSLVAGRDMADADVAVGFYQQAKGYTRTVTKTVMDPKKPDEAIVQTTVEEVGPNLAAAKLWMHNRQGRHGRWQADPDKGVGGALGAGLGAGIGAILASIDGQTRGLSHEPGGDED